ncbi:hypothetical protein GCM10011384_34610 [Psychrobacillus lasiicapitis]|nr:hypothetical protein GCM10011384_34610 [Psychrobacillus lasiicapitis]
MSSRTISIVGVALTVMIFVLIIALKFFLGNRIYLWIKDILNIINV